MSTYSQKPSPNDKAPQEKPAIKATPVQVRRQQFETRIQQQAEQRDRALREQSPNIWGSAARRPTNL